MSYPLYMEINLLLCSSCGAKPKKGTHFFHHSPDPAIAEHLSHTDTVDTNSTVCACHAIGHIYQYYEATTPVVVHHQPYLKPRLNCGKMHYLQHQINLPEQKYPPFCTYIAKDLQQKRHFSFLLWHPLVLWSWRVVK